MTEPKFIRMERRGGYDVIVVGESSLVMEAEPFVLEFVRMGGQWYGLPDCKRAGTLRNDCPNESWLDQQHRKATFEAACAREEARPLDVFNAAQAAMGRTPPQPDPNTVAKSFVAYEFEATKLRKLCRQVRGDTIKALQQYESIDTRDDIYRAKNTIESTFKELGLEL